MNIPDEIHIPDVTPDQYAKLVQHFKSQGGSVGDAQMGFAENSCFATKYQYDAARKMLCLEPVRLMPNLKPARLRKLVINLMNPRSAVFALVDGSTIYKPTPHACATYNWAIGFLANNSGGVLTYAGNSTQDGQFSVQVSSIPAGAQPSDHQDGFWQNKGSKDSVQGCHGSVSYQLADGVTLLTIYYDVNTLSAVSCSAALSGTNAARYTATVDQQTEFYYAAAYLYPYVTIAPVN
jgi:hypothetical protein